MAAAVKPLGRKAYGSIGHLPDSRLGPGDHMLPEGQARICTVKVRDGHDRVIVQEKLDGSCTAVALVNGAVLALGRAGYLASSSPYRQHQLFAAWVREREARFRDVLAEGERLVGEWMAQAHGTLYHLGSREPWGVFDIIGGTVRLPFDEFVERVGDRFERPHLLHDGEALPIADAWELLGAHHWPCEGDPEGVVYRVEHQGKVDFLAKWVRLHKVDGQYLKDGKEIWNWEPQS